MGGLREVLGFTQDGPFVRSGSETTRRAAVRGGLGGKPVASEPPAGDGGFINRPFCCINFRIDFRDALFLDFY